MDEQVNVVPEVPVTVKRGRGRPKGSLNKPKVKVDVQVAPEEVV